MTNQIEELKSLHKSKQKLECIYLGQIKLNKDNQTEEVKINTRLTWMSFGKL